METHDGTCAQISATAFHETLNLGPQVWSYRNTYLPTTRTSTDWTPG